MTPAITNILVATDAGPSAVALAFAKKVARSVGASLHETTVREIANHAAGHGADCIVMSDGCQAVGRGRVADEVANEARCPVLEVHGHGGVRLHAPVAGRRQAGAERVTSRKAAVR
jgi:nucleotide-binding universal stress UspA family protein